MMQRLLKSLLLLPLICPLSHPVYSSSFEITPSIYFFNYKEFSRNDRLLDEEKGVLPGLKLGFSHAHKDDSMTAHLSLYDGSVGYTGQTQSGTPIKTDTDTTLFNLGFKLIPEKLSIIPGHLFLGFQYWRWDRDILSTNTVQGLHEIYSWQEFELGLQLKSDINRQSNYWLDMSALYILNPNMDVYLPSSKVKLDLGSEPGFRIRAGKSWNNNNNMYLSFNMFVEYWEFGRSNTVFTDDFFGNAAYITEPRSESLHSGLELSLIMQF